MKWKCTVMKRAAIGLVLAHLLMAFPSYVRADSHDDGPPPKDSWSKPWERWLTPGERNAVGGRPLPGRGLSPIYRGDEKIPRQYRDVKPNNDFSISGQPTERAVPGKSPLQRELSGDTEKRPELERVPLFDDEKDVRFRRPHEPPKKEGKAPAEKPSPPPSTGGTPYD
jgi:hypothetical protein